MQFSGFARAPRGMQQQQQPVPHPPLHVVHGLTAHNLRSHLLRGYRCRQDPVAAAVAARVVSSCSTCVPHQHRRQHTSTLQQQSGGWHFEQLQHVSRSCGQCRCRAPPAVCRSSAADNQPLPEGLAQQQGQQQQEQQQGQQQVQQQQQQPGDTGVVSEDVRQPVVLPHLTHMQPPPQPVSVPPLLAWLPPSLLLHLRALAGFLAACWGLLREFHAPSLGEALRRLVLVLGASLALIVVVSTIDSGWLYVYLLNARRVPVAA